MVCGFDTAAGAELVSAMKGGGNDNLRDKEMMFREVNPAVVCQPRFLIRTTCACDEST